MKGRFFYIFDSPLFLSWSINALAPKIADRDAEVRVAGKTQKRPFDDFIFDILAESESENEPPAAAVGC